MNQIKAKKIGELLKSKRREMGLSLAELSDQIDINHDYLSKYEKGIKPITFDNYIKLRDFFNIRNELRQIIN